MPTLAHLTRRTLQALDRPMGSAAPRDRSGRRRHPRGIALILALVTIALVSASVVEFTYETRVNLALASNTRDRVKSYFLARSAVNLTKLLLYFQFALTQESRATEDDMGRLINRAIRRSNFQMYQYVDLLMKPFNSGRIETPVGGIDLQDTGVEGFGNFTGEFTVKVTPESGRINVNEFAKPKFDEKDLTPLCAMLADERYDPLFELKDDSGELMTRRRVLANVVDFIDPDSQALALTELCTVESAGGGGDERRPYERKSKRGSRMRPRDAKITHVEDLYQVHGMNAGLMDVLRDQLTVYNVGKPNANVATAPVFYAVLCQNAQLPGTGNNKDALRGFNLCARNPAVAIQALWLSLALDGVRAFFENPISVLMAYVGTQESKLMPSAKKGQPVAFLSVSQLPAYIQDFQQSPALIAQFVQYSPTYLLLASQNPAFQLDPLNPQLPQWTAEFDRSGLTRSITTSTPEIYRIKAVGKYGSTTSTIESVMDFNKTVRRLPSEKQMEEQANDPEALKELKRQRRAASDQMPRGRVLFWREY